MSARVTGPVRIVGAGLLGASIGLALRERGVDVILADSSRAALALVARGAFDHAADVVLAELAAHPTALVTDVASVKSGILAELRESGAELSRYIGSHPMGGRERGGAVSARTDLFLGRPWIVTPHEGSTIDQVRRVEDLALDVGATPVDWNAGL